MRGHRCQEVDRLDAAEVDRALRREVDDLRASRRRIAVAENDERRRIERVLHEGVQQQLVGFAANLELAAASIDPDPDRAAELLREMSREVRRALEATRMLAAEVYPPLLDAGGLTVALRSAAIAAGAQVRIDVAPRTVCPPDIAAVVYFSCLDVLRVAPAGSPTTIVIRNDAGGVAFEIATTDDLDQEMTLLRDRVEALDGRATVGSGDVGSVVTGWVPLPG